MISICSLVRPNVSEIFAPSRRFSSNRLCLSNIGRKPIVFDSKAVDVTFTNPYRPPSPSAGPPSKRSIEQRSPYTISIKGPLGHLSRTVPAFVRIHKCSHLLENTSALSVAVDFPQTEIQRANWGTARAHIANMIQGVTVGWSSNLQISGTGYRAIIIDGPRGKMVQLKLGFANTIDLLVPKGVVANCPSQDRIVISGPNKEVVSQFAATIRSYKPPEPYKLKGIFVNGETLSQKEGKKRR